MTNLLILKYLYYKFISYVYNMDTTLLFAVLGVIGALAYLGNPFSTSNNDTDNNNTYENKPIIGGKKSRKKFHKNIHKSRKH
jgi:hypothetical protein